jgi:alkanesulfonate monooxygenase SsuD/methylene tetrahydromethanopterin reductase-like flavin-dependent oxidoreductase (luciferase family)
MSLLSVPDHHPSLPRSVAQLYGELIAQAELGDRLGCDTFFTAEHHFHHYGAVPDPAVLLSAIAQRTRRLRLGTAISVLTFRSPFQVAESYAMLDMLSGGRLVLGVGSGYLKHEFEGFRIDPAEKRDRFDANFAILRRLLAGEAVDGITLNVAPYQREVPVYVAVLRPEAAYHVGRQGFGLMVIPYASLASFDEIPRLVAEHRRGLAEAGRQDAKDAIVICFHACVAETDAAARRIAESPFDLYVATRLYAKSDNYDGIMRNGLSLMGSVDTVVDKLMSLHELGVGHVAGLHNFGAMADVEVQRSMRMMMEEVMPRVEARIAAGRISAPARGN